MNKRQETFPIVRIATAGSVDDGKSTLLGRMLVDAGMIYSDHLKTVGSQAAGSGRLLSFADLTDGLRSEREQQITIDVAYRYFSSSTRRYILADSPGHEQYTRNMVTAASTADVLLLLVDSGKGFLEQTRRHLMLAAFLNVPHIIVAVNKMDLYEFSADRFAAIHNEVLKVLQRFSVETTYFVPVSALHGDNVVSRSERCSWYHGGSIYELLESLQVQNRAEMEPLRFPVQQVIHASPGFRGYAGQILSGTLRPGSAVTIFPSGEFATVTAVSTVDASLGLKPLPQATAPLSVVAEFDREIDISRGTMISARGSVPQVVSSFDATIVWFDDAPLKIQSRYILKHTTRDVTAEVVSIAYCLDTDWRRHQRKIVERNDIAYVTIRCQGEIFLDSHKTDRSTGSFILIDTHTHFTAAAGFFLDPMKINTHSRTEAVQPLFPDMSLVTSAERKRSFGHPACTLWFTGLSGSGKSTISRMLERRLFDEGYKVYRIDGDTLRTGINRDLGFSTEDRSENIRRAAEIAKLFNDAGFIVLCAFISPSATDRKHAGEIIGADLFREIFVDAPLEVCEERDPHGLYRKARAGEVRHFTGVSAPYDVPSHPYARLDTAVTAPAENVDEIIALIKPFLAV